MPKACKDWKLAFGILGKVIKQSKGIFQTTYLYRFSNTPYAHNLRISRFVKMEASRLMQFDFL